MPARCQDTCGSHRALRTMRGQTHGATRNIGRITSPLSGMDSWMMPVEVSMAYTSLHASGHTLHACQEACLIGCCHPLQEHADGVDDERMPLGLRGQSVRSAHSSGGSMQQGSLNGMPRDRRRSSSYGRVGRRPTPARRPHSHARRAAPGNLSLLLAALYKQNMHICHE